MNITIKGLQIGNFIITTKNQLKNIEMNIEPKEVFDLFIKALAEHKIVFSEKGEEK
jgi:hypothetical protein